MPRDGLEQYSPPPGTNGITNYTIESTKYNGFVADITADLNNPRPISSGGTGATSADGALNNLSAEKKKQIVTNWDTMVWMPGSFYAATTAIGTAPVAGHAFAGIVYYANATDFVCEATDLTDPANPDQYIRVMAAGVWGAWVRLNPNTSSANLAEYVFDNQVTFPPGSGQVRFNNITQNSTTEVFISHLSPMGVDNTAALTFYLKSGVDLVIQDKDEGSKYKVYTATANAVLSGSDFRVTVTFKSGGTDIVSGQRVLAAVSGEAQRVQQRQLIYAAPFDALAYNGMQINGSMEVSQERGGTATSAPGYVIDGWKVNWSGTMAMNSAQASAPTIYPGFANVLVATVTTAQASLAAGDFSMLWQSIEGYRIARLAWGGPSASPITIGFWSSHHRTGLYSGSVRNGVFNRCYVFTYTQNAADTPQYNVVTVPGDTTGTWDIGNTTGMHITFSMGAGSTFTAPSTGSWLAGNYQAGPGQINSVAATSDQFRITGVVVLPGTEGPSAARSALIMRPYDQELLTCKRYYELADAMWNGNTTATAAYYTMVYFKVEKRVLPTVTSKVQGGGPTNGSFGTRSAGALTTLVANWGGISGTTTNAGGFQDIITIDARL